MAASANAGGATVSTTEPWKQVSDNLVMNTRLLEAFAFQRLQRVVCLGSITLYQEFGDNIKEDELDLNQDPFPAYFWIGWVVRFIEKLCRFWHEKMGIEIIMVRSANIFGPYAKFDPQTSTFIPAIIRRAVDRIDPFEVWGTPDVTRDVKYAEDFARAVVLLLDNTNIKFDVFNLGSGERTTVGEVVNWALKYAGHQPARIVYQSDNPSTNKFRAVDSSKVRRATGWAPRHTIEEGIMKTTQWWVENRNWWKR
jgi:GDP-L-fucose synthase